MYKEGDIVVVVCAIAIYGCCKLNKVAGINNDAIINPTERILNKLGFPEYAVILFSDKRIPR
ncbi:MAG: hypothetical protein WA667_12565 [Candidatus Nitrosopolaris sp.]